MDEKNFNLSRNGFIFLFFPPWEWRVMLLSFLSQSRKSLIWGTNWRQPRKKETELKIKKSGVRQLLVPHVNFFFFWIWWRNIDTTKAICLICLLLLSRSGTSARDTAEREKKAWKYEWRSELSPCYVNLYFFLLSFYLFLCFLVVMG